MNRFAPALAVAALVVAVSAPAAAGPPHVLSSQVLGRPPADAAYAVSPDLDDGTRKALTRGLQEAGLSVVASDAPHLYLVSVNARASALCTRSCSSLTGLDEARLDDHYRHMAVVAAQRNSGADYDPALNAAWFTVLQSDGLSDRRGDYLPALLRYGARAYGRNTPPEEPPHLSPRLTALPPNVVSSPGA